MILTDLVGWLRSLATPPVQGHESPKLFTRFVSLIPFLEDSKASGVSGWMIDWKDDSLIDLLIDCVSIFLFFSLVIIGLCVVLCASQMGIRRSIDFLSRQNTSFQLKPTPSSSWCTISYQTGPCRGCVVHEQGVSGPQGRFDSVSLRFSFLGFLRFTFFTFSVCATCFVLEMYSTARILL